MGSVDAEAAGPVVTRMQYMTAAEMKYSMAFLRAAEVGAAVLLALILVAKLRDKDQWLVTMRRLAIADAAVFLFLLLLLLAVFAAFAAHFYRSTR